MKIKPHTEMRDGPYGRRNWCLIHETWWKLCDCPGQANKTVRLPMDHVPLRGDGFAEALERLRRAVDELTND